MPVVPRIDDLAGIGCYCTQFMGTGGSIKRAPEGFVVSEIVFESLLRDMSKAYDPAHRYPLYELEKKGVDSNHALFEIEKRTRLRLKVMGIKDAKAVTRQYASLVKPERNPPATVQTQHTLLTLRGYSSKPVDKSLLAGNAFTVTIYDGSVNGIEEFSSEIDAVANFYGLQRFGSERLVSHLVGRHIVKREFQKAVELLLTYTTEYDSKFSREIREQLRDPAAYPRMARALPRGMDIERNLVVSLSSGKDPIQALRSVPVGIRRIFVQAFQAFIFNRCLSMCILEGKDITHPCEGDLVFEADGELGLGKLRRYDKQLSMPLIPAAALAGYSFQSRDSRFEKLTEKIMNEEKVSPRDFYIKEMDELSQQGGYRQAPLYCKGFAFDAANQSVSFRLPKGSYATTLLREIIKPADPIASGF